VFVNTISWKKSQSLFTHRSGEHNKSTPRKTKSITLNVI